MIAAVLALALQSAAAPADPELDELNRAYDQSCTQRAYGTFDDICESLSDQIHRYEREHARRGVATARKPRTVPAPVNAPLQAAPVSAAPAPAPAADGTPAPRPG